MEVTLISPVPYVAIATHRLPTRVAVVPLHPDYTQAGASRPEGIGSYLTTTPNVLRPGTLIHDKEQSGQSAPA